MIRSLLPLLLLLLLLAAACTEKETPGPTPAGAFASLYTLSSSGTPRQIGDARFEREGNLVRLTIELYTLTPGSRHALHLHEGSCEDPGMHWNGGSSEKYCTIPSMGTPWGRPYLGDIGNIEIGSDGKGSLSLQTDLWALGDGSALDVMGKVLMVHAEPEDFALECDPNHTNHPHTNPKIACGQVFKRVRMP
ncbi:superoxide dismutase family protein [Cesiribacter andamanensis]|uniref:Superoxide dismutase-like protein yojM n=1 Tax=Cesiribacter andamanensis AMV16 TaxID=1279009 RepID=M7N0Z8_9BACT|nr:superoxide dismutase family protein [Cesiribacter andamanensis]EMR00982.1 Superoxide dismutase-like protein yojM precursor [Cesiribacter andamanensis AMV16]